MKNIIYDYEEDRFLKVNCDDFSVTKFGDSFLEDNNIGYLATSMMAKKCFAILKGDKNDQIDINDDESIKNVFETYKIAFESTVKKVKGENASLDKKSISDIREIVTRILNYIGKKEIKLLSDDCFMIDDDIYYILISKNSFKTSDNIKKCVSKTQMIFERYEKYDANKIINIKNWIIYNPRLNEEWICDLQTTVNLYDNREKELKKNLVESAKKFEEQFESKDIDIDLWEFDKLYQEVARRRGDLEKQDVFNRVKKLMNSCDVSYKDAFYIFIECLEIGHLCNGKEVVYDGSLYMSKTELYESLFPECSLDDIRNSVNQYMRYYSLSWEEAVLMMQQNMCKKRNRKNNYYL